MNSSRLKVTVSSTHSWLFDVMVMTPNRESVVQIHGLFFLERKA